MSQIEFTNTLTRSGAQKKYEEFLKNVKANNTRCWMWLLLIALSTVMLVPTICYYTAGLLERGLCAFAIFVAILFLVSVIESFESTCSVFWPHVYAYHQILAEYRILGSKIETANCGACNVVLTVANDKNEVSYKWLYGFERITKTDIDKITVDLVEGKIYEPYMDLKKGVL